MFSIQDGDEHQLAVALTPGCPDVELSRSLLQCGHEDTRHLALWWRTRISNGPTSQSQVDLHQAYVEAKGFVHLYLSSDNGTYN